MAKKFEVNLSKLNLAYTTYETEADELTTILDTLKKGIETLRDSDWKSDASTQYFSLYDDSWAGMMENQIKIVEEMKSLLKDAKDTYEKVNDAVSDIRM